MNTETLLSVLHIIAYQNKQLQSAHCLEQTIGFLKSKDAMRAAF